MMIFGHSTFSININVGQEMRAEFNEETFENFFLENYKDNSTLKKK